MDKRQKNREELQEETASHNKEQSENIRADSQYENPVDIKNEMPMQIIGSILRAMPVPSIIVSNDGIISYFDDRAAVFFQLKKGEFEGKHLHQFAQRVNSDSFSGIIGEAFQRIMEGEKSISDECELAPGEQGEVRSLKFTIKSLSFYTEITDGAIISINLESSRSDAEGLLKKRELELRRQNRKLIELKKSKALTLGDLGTSLQEITKASAEALKVERASIWFYSDDFSRIICKDLYRQSEKKHSQGAVLEAELFPTYFMTLTQQFIIAVQDAHSDPRTSEFSGGYLEHYNIGALLDIPIRSGSKTVGVLCFEHVGGPREWNHQEQSFAGSMSDFVSMALESYERKLSEQKMLEAEERFRSLFENVQIGLYRSTPDGNIILANPAIAKMLDFDSVNQVYELDLEKGGFGEDYPRDDFKKVMEAKGEITGLESSWKRKSGKMLYVRENAKAVKDQDGNIIHYEGTIEDITEWKLAKNKLNEAARRYNELIERSRDGWVESDMEGNVYDCNSIFHDMLGYSREEIIGLSYRDITPAKYLNYEMHIVREQVLKNGYSDIFEKHYLCKDGSTFPVELRLYLNYEDGKPVGIWGFVRDITERKNFERQLVEAKEKAEESDRLKTNLLANMSHEFRTPVNAILGFSDLLVEEIEDEELRSMAVRIKNSGTRLIKTLSLILELAQLEMQPNDKSVVTEKINIAEETLLIFQEYKEVADRKGLEFLLKLEKDNISVLGKKEMLTRILRNIIDNALKYTEDGSVSIELKEEEFKGSHWGVINVVDTGIGINSEQQELIFQEFRQASEGLGRGYEGTGLGLTISKRMVELMDGEISVESDPGSGSVFSVRFPLFQETTASKTGKKTS